MEETNTQYPCDISVVLPVFNEEENLQELYDKLSAVLVKLERTYELIFVDDGSTDNSAALLKEINHKDEKVKIVRLKRNFGQTASLSAGIEYSHGSIIVLMDSDLQHDPEDLPSFIRHIDKGYDVVSGWRKNRVDNFWLRRIPSFIANMAMAKMSGIKLHDFGTTFKAYRKEVIKNVKLYGDFHRFIPVLASKTGASIIEIPIKNIERNRGRSSYNLLRTWTVFFDLLRINFLSRYLSRPLQFFGTFGLFVSLAGFTVMSYLIFLKYAFGLGILVHRPVLFILSILLFITGIQFLTLGLLGEIVSKVYHELDRSKTFYIREIIE